MKFPIRLSIRITSNGDDCEDAKLDKLLKLGEKIMSVISEFAAKQKTHNDKIDSAVSGLQGDIASLNAKIVELQNSAGEVTPEDQAFLDEIQARSEAIANKLEALDALTPPTVPA